MTPEHAKKLLPLVAAHADGSVIEAQNAQGTWIRLPSPDFTMPLDFYRIKPEAKYRPWTVDEVPVGKVVRWKESGGRAAITAVSKGYILVELNWFPAEHYYDYFTMDDGSPCGVAVGE